MIRQLLTLLLLFSFTPFAYATVEQARFSTKLSYSQTVSYLTKKLNQCQTEKAGWFNSGKKIVVDEVNSTTQLTVEQYQIDGSVYTELGTIMIVNKQPTLIIVENKHLPFGGINIHLIEQVKSWLTGNKNC